MLKPLFFTPYTTSELSATGWLKRQLEIQAKGLGGNLDKVWRDVRDSKWIGGDGPAWVRMPYWLDGTVPLAWLLDDADLKKRVTQYITYIMDHQEESGWLIPIPEEERAGTDIQPLYLMLKALVVYYECSGDSRVEQVVYKALQSFSIHIERNTMRNYAATRWYEALIAIFWLYERRPEEWLIDLAYKMYDQGVDFEKTFDHWRYQKPQERGRWNHMLHVVNMAMFLKFKGLFSRISGEDPSAFAKKAIRILLRDHGMAVDHFTGDECLAGDSPLAGSELCSVVDAMFSYECLLAVSGDSEWSDRLENLAYNAFPATVSPDMWSHQYDQMTNQIECSRFTPETKPFRTNGIESNLFGLEPTFGCCTANFVQGWPKFALSTFMKAKDGVAVTAIAPALLRTKISGVPVSLENITGYPFEDGYKIKVRAEQAVAFTLHLRVPSHVEEVLLDGVAAPLPENGWLPMAAVWNGERTVSVTFRYSPKMVKRPNDMYCVRRGPLLYSLPIKERWEKLEYVRDEKERKFPYCDYEVFPMSKWNYGFAGRDFQFETHAISDIPFNPETPPVSLKASMAEIDWPYDSGKCAEQPAGRKPVAAPETLRLIPYGCTNLRMTEMPIVE